MPDEMTGAENAGSGSESVTTNLDAQTPQTGNEGGAETQGAGSEGGAADPFSGLAQGAGKEGAEDNASFVLPEGMQSDPALLSEYGALGAELGISTQQLQKLLDFGVKKGVFGALDAEELLNKKWREEVDGWTAQIKSDAEVGGVKLNESLTLARRGIDKLGGAELLKALNYTGAGVHPAVFKAFVKIGRMFGEDRMAQGGGAAGGGASMSPQDMARLLYPGMKHG